MDGMDLWNWIFLVAMVGVWVVGFAIVAAWGVRFWRLEERY
jgi:hypothetical protein